MARRNTPKGFKPLRSGLEREHYEQLKESGIGFEYEPEKITYRKRVVKGICKKCGCTDVYQQKTYIPDWVLANGIRIESKGRLTSQDRSKLVAVKQQYPELDLRIVFKTNNKINKAKSKRYAEWASENGFKFGINTIPKSWLK
jgi:hypothetical protein